MNIRTVESLLLGCVLAVLAIQASAAEIFPRFRPLPFIVQDAEYSRSLDRIIIVSSTPGKRLYIYEPKTGNFTGVKLPLVPSSVSVAPNGKFAAVGHDGWVSYVDLSSGTLLDTFEASTDVLDVVLAGNGYIYAFPRADQWESIYGIEIATGTVTRSTGDSIYAGTVAKLHPDGDAIYGADNGLSPSDIEKYDITGGTASYLYDSPYHGDYAMCGDLWLSRDGLRIFTRCGNVFRASVDRSRDMTYNGSLSELDFVEFLDHSKARGKVVAIPGAGFHSGATADSEAQIYDYTFLAFRKRVGLPPFQAGPDPFAAHGRYVFFSRDGTVFHVLAEADPSSALLYDHGVMSIPLDRNIAGSVSGLDFGNVPVGESRTRLLTIANTGAAALEVQAISGVSSPFRLRALDVSLPLTLAPMESTRIRVSFRPTNADKAGQTLIVHTNDPDEPEKGFALTATGVAGTAQAVGPSQD